jgi:hypothetical protein
LASSSSLASFGSFPDATDDGCSTKANLQKGHHPITVMALLLFRRGLSAEDAEDAEGTEALRIRAARKSRGLQVPVFGVFDFLVDK